MNNCESQQEAWKKEVEYFIVMLKKSFRDKLWSFFRNLFYCDGFTIRQKDQICCLLGLPRMEFEGLFHDGGQLPLINFKNVFERFNRLEWLVNGLSEVAKKEFILDWLQSPNLELNGKPIDFLSDDESFKKLQEIIFRLASGMPT